MRVAAHRFINLDEELIAAAQRITGVKVRTFHEGLKALIARESARRLARLGDASPTCGRFPPAVGMILVDASVWVDHLREEIAALAAALEQDIVLTHPLVAGEMACGNLRKYRAAA